jgi:16S rRNA (guanine966-N2)-methyltransferase
MPRNNRTGRPTDRLADATHAAASRHIRRHANSDAGRRGEVRIIGGAWRGRKLHFPPSDSLRPTPDRVRETLFNWLQFEIEGKRCLDLFAGSGALGFEALSRGAEQVVFVERERVAVEAIRAGLRTLQCDRAVVEALDAFSFLQRGSERPFDIVFIDPPYAERWLDRACAALEAGGWLAPRAWVYLEDAAAEGAPIVPAGWTLLRSKKAGDVGYHLARRGGTPDATRISTTGGSA